MNVFDLNTVLDQANDIIYACDLEGNFIYVNEYTTRIAGTSHDQLIGSHYTTLVHPDKVDEVVSFYKAQIKNKQKHTYLEFPTLLNSGNVLWIGQNVNTFFDDEGVLQGIYAIARPITKQKSIEHSLTESEAKLQTIIDSALDAVIVIDERGFITEWNKQAERIFGWTKDKALERRLSETIVPQHFREAHEKGMNHFLKTGEGPVLNQRIEIEAMRKSGEIFPVELTIIPNKIDDTYFFSAFVRDLSEEKRSERILHALNDLAIRLLKTTSLEEIAWEITKNTIEQLGFDDCVIYVKNRSRNKLVQMAAYGPKNPEKYVIKDPIEIEIGQGIVGSVALTGKAELIGDTSKDDRYVIDDDRRYSELSVPIISSGEVIGVIDSEHKEKNFFDEDHLNTFQTIANLVSSRLKNALIEKERLDAIQALKESEERWASLVSNQPEATQISKGGVVIYINPAGLKLYDADSADDMIGRNLLDFSAEIDQDLLNDRLEMLEHGESTPRIELDITTLKGNKKTIEVISTPVFYEGEQTVQTIARDVTEKKEAEVRREKLLKELAKANEKLHEYAHIVSHDLKAPLRAISSLSEWVMEDYADALDDEGKKQLNMIVDNVFRMDQLIEGILQYSTMDSNEEEDSTFESKEIIEKIISSLRLTDKVKFSYTGDFPNLTFNLTKFQQVVLNLISNAIKHNDKSEIEIELGVNDLDDKFMFWVKDNGPGIPEEYGDSIFGLFNKASHITSSTGIGLSIAQKIIDASKGEIWFESDSNKGTTFKFTIPK